MYDIDAALGQLDRIWWRVPQHTTEVHTGDGVVIWRSGQDAGIVGVGRVANEPALHSMDDDDRRFVLSDAEDRSDQTRVLVIAQPCPFVPKAVMESLPQLSGSQLLRAPLGTVFPISPEEWEALSPLLPTLPTLDRTIAVGRDALPTPFAWGQRVGTCNDLPGGYDGYLQAGREILGEVDDQQPTQQQLVGFVMSRFDRKPTSAHNAVNALRVPGFIRQHGGTWELTPAGKDWLETESHARVIAQLHRAVRFIGEMLAETIEPRTTTELLVIAGERYGLGWTTETQVHRRRGWLQSAGMIGVTGDRRLHITDAGQALLEALQVTPPAPAPPGAERPATVDNHEVALGAAADTVSHSAAIAQELSESSIASSDPDRFERAVRDAFQALGFEAKWLGRSGRTDVLVQADIGLGRTYRVVVDAKSTSSGSVSDGQVDWITLQEHRVKHEADFIAMVGPSPKGQRLFDRAREAGVVVISVERLAALVRQHEAAPLGLSDYRSLFDRPGELEPEILSERAEDWLRQVNVTRAALDEIRRRAERSGPLTARELSLVLDDDPLVENTTVDELQRLLDTLASPLIGVLEGDPQSGYLAVSAPGVITTRMELLSRQLTGGGKHDEQRVAD